MSIAEKFKTLPYGPAPESDKEVMEWLKSHDQKFKLFIGGKFVESQNGEQFKTIAPGDGRFLADVAQAGKDDVDAAVKAARDAQSTWSALSGAERGRYLYALARAMYDQARMFEVVESLDNGKPFRETHNADIQLAIKHFDHHADYAAMMDMDPQFKGHSPYGVAGQIIPWNFPLLMLAWKVAPALATGNTVVIKPAEQTPLSALMFAELCEQVGLPSGVVNIVTGDGKTGALITKHPDIDKVAFTGSTEVGRIIRKATAGTGKGLTLELGGKSPFIVFDDADLDSAVEGVVNAIWFNQGEVCCGGSRLLVQESVYPQFIQKLKTRMGKLHVGGPLDKSIDIGAVVDEVQRERINSFVEEAREGGAEVYQPVSCPVKGAFYPPTLVTNVNTADRIVQEEVFGPVVAALSFRTHEEAIALANNTVFGLAASVWTESMSRANEVASRVKAGTVWINGTNRFDASSGFGGYRESGYGREGGFEGLHAYLKPDSERGNDKSDVEAPNRDYKPSFLRTPVDLTRKLFVGGAEKRADGGQMDLAVNAQGTLVGRIPRGNRKDIRDAVEAAASAESSWAGKTGYQRGQVLKFVAERLSQRQQEFAAALHEMTLCGPNAAHREVDESIAALFNFAALASKYEGKLHIPSSGRTIIPALNEPIGVVGMACPNERPLLSFVTMTAAALAMGNTVVAVPSEKYPLPALDLTQIFRAADVPGGAVNIVTGPRDELAKTLAQHRNVDAMWYHGTQEGSAMVERESAESNLKQTWVNNGEKRDWTHLSLQRGAITMVRRASNVKNIWVPWGEGVAP